MARLPFKLWLFCIPAAITVAAIWLPLGFVEIPQVEEWRVFSVFQEHGPVFWVTSGEFATHRLRPLFLFLDAVVYSTPVPYLSMHALLALALILKGSSMAYVAYWLTANRLLAVLAAVVFIVNPADTMQMGFRSLGIIWPVALSVCAVALLLASTEAATDSKRMQLASAAAVLMLIAGLMYEAALMMAATPLILLLTKHGSKTYSVALNCWRQALIWIAALGANVLYVVVFAGSGRTYQGALLGGAPPLLQMPKYLVTTGLYRALLQCWYDGLSMFWANISFLPYLLGAIVVCILCYVALRGAAGPDLSSARLGIRTLLSGIVLAALGYAPFLVSIPHIHITQRTYLFASIGGTLFALGALILIRRSRIALAALAGLLIVSGIGSQWEQLAHYGDISARQRMYMSGILNAAPDAGQKPGHPLLITDNTGAMSNTWMLRGDNFASALTYLYGRSVRAVVCTGPNNLLSSFNTDPYGTPGKCVATEKGWEIGKGIANAFEISRENTTHLVIDPDGTVTRRHDKALPPSAAQVERARSIIGCFPCSYTPREAVSGAFRFDFSTWWSLDSVPWGGGWSDTGWIIPPATPVSYAWMIAPVSNLYFRILPQGSEYRVSVRVVGSVSALARGTIAVSLNGEKIDYTWITPDTLTGRIKTSVLSSGLNELRLEARPEKQFSVSNEIDWVEVAPIL